MSDLSPFSGVKPPWAGRRQDKWDATGCNKRQQDHSAHRRGGHDVRPFGRNVSSSALYSVFQPSGRRFFA